MTPPDQFVFVQGLQTGQSRRTKDLQLSNARSHAASIVHQRLRSKPLPLRWPGNNPAALNENAEEVVLPFVPVQQPKTFSPPPSPIEEQSGHPSTEISLLLADHPISPPRSPGASDASGEIDDRPSQRNKIVGGRKVEQSPKGTSPEISTQRASTRRFFQIQTTIAPNTFSGMRIDPFNCIPGSIDRRIASTIDFYNLNISPSNDVVCYTFDVSNIYARFLETLPTKHFFDAGMGVIQVLHDNIRFPSSQPSMHVLKHRGVAMERVRQKILQSKYEVDDVTILAMVFLALLEGSLNNKAAHDLHKRNIAAIVSRRGGLKSLSDGSLVKGTLLQFDTLWALESGTTIFPGERPPQKSEYPKHPFSTDLCRLIGSLPLGFEKLALEGKLSFEVLPVIQRASHLTYLRPAARSNVLTTARTSTRTYNEFAEACPPLSDTGANGSVMERLLCTSILCYSYIAYGSRSSARGARSSRRELTNTISLYKPDSEAEGDCMVWMWMVAIDAWSTGSQLHYEGSLLLRKLQLEYPNTRDIDVAIGIAKRFLWTESLDASVRTYWASLDSDG